MVDVKNGHKRASLVVHWLRIHLPMQGTWIQSLVWEDPTCLKTTKPLCHNYWACALEPKTQLLSQPTTPPESPPVLEPVLHNKRNHRNEKPAYRNERKATRSNEDQVQPNIIANK